VWPCGTRVSSVPSLPGTHLGHKDAHSGHP
jgi:hypothetical protein